MRKLLTVGGIAGLIIVGLGACPVVADPGNQRTVQFTIHESQNIYNTDPSVLPTFKSSWPLCESGTFTDGFTSSDWKGASSKLFLLKGTSVYTCDDGTGSFVATKQVFATFSDDGSLTTTGPFKITGGTGAYAGLRGSGTNAGFALADGTAEAVISGTLVP